MYIYSVCTYMYIVSTCGTHVDSCVYGCVWEREREIFPDKTCHYLYVKYLQYAIIVDINYISTY